MRGTWRLALILIAPSLPASAFSQSRDSSANLAFLENQSLVRSACNPIPTQAEVNTGELGYQDRYYSARQAAKLGIPIVNLSVSRDYLVIVRDYRRSVRCNAVDGSGELEYGQVIRAVIEALSTDASVNSSLATLAAQGTLSAKSQFFYLYKNGLFNPQIDAIIARVSGKVFDVENYSLYQSIMPEMIGLMSQPGTTLSVRLIGVIPKSEDPTFTSASAITWGFSQIAGGKKCAEAQQKFAAQPQLLSAVASAYEFVMGDCGPDVPSNVQRDRAKTLLAGIKVR